MSAEASRCDLWSSRAQRALGLVRDAALACALDPELALVHTRAALLAPRRAHRGPGGASGLNHDGTPVQVAFTLGGHAPEVRLVVDPASHLEDPNQRQGLVYQRLYGDDAAAALIADPFVRQCAQRLHDRLGPGAALPASAFGFGPVWFATPLASARGYATYVDMSVHPLETAWQSARGWLCDELPDTKQVAVLCDHAQDGYWLSSASVAGACAASTRLKLYMRMLDEHASHQALASVAPPLGNPRLAELLQWCWAGLAIPRGEALVSVGFAQASGQLVDAKVDVGVSTFGWTGRETWERIDALCARQDWHAPALRELVQAERARLSFVGLGVDARGALKGTLYFKPGVNVEPLTGVWA